MVLCICRAVTDREIDAAVRAGARSVDAVGACCGAGTDCGACLDELADALSSCSRACATCPRSADRSPGPMAFALVPAL